MSRKRCRNFPPILKGYFSLNDFYAWAACNGQNSKEYLPTRELQVFIKGQNVVGVFDLHARDASECQKSLSEK